MKRLLLFALLALILSGCLQPPSEEIQELQAVEVREYEGKNLSSIGDFRENSIKGPQNVNIDNYSLKISGLVDEEKSFSYDEVLDSQKFKKVVTLNCVEGWSATILWEGIMLKYL